MIKQVWVAECDICGYHEQMKSVQGRYNENEHVLPEGWGHPNNKNFHLCPSCTNIIFIQHNKEAKHD